MLFFLAMFLIVVVLMLIGSWLGYWIGQKLSHWYRKTKKRNVVVKTERVEQKEPPEAA
jgi:hypothetical protein